MEKTLKITDKTHAKLMSVGKKGETFDQIIDRLIDYSHE